MSSKNSNPKPLKEGYVPNKGSLNSSNPPKIQNQSSGKSQLNSNGGK